MQIPVGWVAASSSNGRTLLHLAKPPNGAVTLCGRYQSERYLPEDHDIPDDTAECGACKFAYAGERAPLRSK